MPDQAEHYREILLEHGHHPHGEGLLSDADWTATGTNPETGDEVHLSVKTDRGRIAGIGFTAKGSAILRASCSLMVESLQGRELAEAQALAIRFRRLLTRDVADEDWSGLGDAEALSGIRQFPARVRCAILPWRTFASIARPGPPS